MQALTDFLDRERGRRLDGLDRSAPDAWTGLDTTAVVARGDRLSALPTPVMTISAAAVDANLAAMAAWCARHGVALAPHGKTSMSPWLWSRQLDAGAWGLTVATPGQLRVALTVGVTRVVVANEIVRPAALTALAGHLDAHPDTDVYHWVDSPDGVHRADAALAAHPPRRPLDVLVELGAPGSRTGVRGTSAALAVADAVLAARHLRLVGVAGYEGTLAAPSDTDGQARVDAFLSDLLTVHRSLVGRYPDGSAGLVSAGGSIWFDRVAAVLAPAAADGATVLLRSGCAVVHDDGAYRDGTPSTRGAGPELRAALHVRASVVSTPEPGLAYLDAGRRDLPSDLGWPVPLTACRGGVGGAEVDLTGASVRAMNDQHTHLVLPDGLTLQVGDVVRLGISHPCTAFDKWALIPVVDDDDLPDPRVVDLTRTYF